MERVYIYLSCNNLVSKLVERMNEELLLSVELLKNTVSRILAYFTTANILHTNVERATNYEFKIELLKEECLYVVQVTNCGSIIWNVVHLLDTIFNPLVFAGLVPNDIAVASFLIRCAKEKNEIAYNLQFHQNCWVFERYTHREDFFNNFYYLEDRLSIIIKYKLLAENLKEFKSSLTEELIHLQQGNTNIKLMFYCGNELFYTNHTELYYDFRNCRLLSSALVTVMKQSLNNEFREKCLNLLQVDNSYDAENVIMSKILIIINENYVRPEKKALTKNKEPDNNYKE